MGIKVKAFEKNDAKEVVAIWNKVVCDGVAFPQETPFDDEEGEGFFLGQTYTGVAKNALTGEVVGVYVLHPNFVGRCSHIAFSAFAVKETARGMGVGEALVTDCKKTAKSLGFRAVQLNVVVASNTAALGLYKKCGLTPLGRIKNGFRLPNGEYEDIIPHYVSL